MHEFSPDGNRLALSLAIVTPSVTPSLANLFRPNHQGFFVFKLWELEKGSVMIESILELQLDPNDMILLISQELYRNEDKPEYDPYLDILEQTKLPPETRIHLMKMIQKDLKEIEEESSIN